MSSTPRPRSPRLAASIVLVSGLLCGQHVPRASAQLDGPKPMPRPFPGRPPGISNVPEPTLLDRARPYLPEGLAMAAEILAGGQVEPGKGWFAAGKSATRFTWAEAASRLDSDRNGSISRAEFPGTVADFRALDRDRNDRLDGDDFQFPSNARERCRSRMILSFADRDHDGKIGPREYPRMKYLAHRDQITRFTFFADAIDDVDSRYTASEKEGLPYLALSDLRQTVDLKARRQAEVTPPDPDGDFETAPRETLLRALMNREIGALGPGPSLGDRAPDFTLATDDGLARVSLTGLLGKRPVVLIFGNYSSPVFRNEAGTLEKLYHRYRDRAEFLLVYIREEHPSGGWVLKENAKAGITLAQPADDQARSAMARECRKKLGLELPMVVDTVDDRVGLLYSGLPDRLYLLDPRGSIAYKGGRGPYGFKPDELEQSLILLLTTEASPPTGSQTPPKAP